MLPYQERVIAEKSALDQNISSLATFTESDIFPTLPEDEQDRLNRQLVIMDDYSAVLGERISAFSAKQ